MNREQFLNTPFEPYDKTREYDAYIAPLVDKLHAECVRLGFPALIVVTVMQSVDGSGGLRAAVHFTGPETTPAELIAASRLLHGETHEAIGVMAADAARGRRQREATTPNGTLEV